jgi:uncharacterized protein
VLFFAPTLDSFMEFIAVTVASFLAGFVDSIVGGGGLILVPAMFAMFPNAHPATLFGVNKSASMWGTAAAAWQYAHRVTMPWRSLLPALVLAVVGSFLGAWAVLCADGGFHLHPGKERHGP